MVPLKSGEFPITLTAIVADSGEFQADIVKKTLFVEVGFIRIV